VPVSLQNGMDGSFVGDDAPLGQASLLGRQEGRWRSLDGSVGDVSCFTLL
jgi:hypothetical protein